ncbi:MAG: HAMP domain-containing histidine kinase, partial [Gammaproteobacteria bacterium]|nr:HAMP domain-containing histidine kinase [Gammaproteobacteria bacterium]
MAEEINNREMTLIAASLMLELNARLGRNREAMVYGQLCIDLARETLQPMRILECSQLMGESAAALGQFDTAYKYLSIHLDSHNRMFTSQSKARIEDYQVRYNLEKKENEALLLRKDNEIYQLQAESSLRYLLGAILMLSCTFFGLAFVVWLYRKQRMMSESLTIALDRAEQATQAKSQFLTRMSHELRTPLNAILGFGQLLEMSMTDQKQKDQAGKIITAGHHLLELINEILDLAKIESGRLEMQIDHLNLNKLLDECESIIRPLAEAADLHLNVVNMEGQSVWADSTRLKQVLLNLLSNAVKYNSQKGSIKLSTHKLESDKLRIIVADTGKGISQEEQKLLFEPFQRLVSDDSQIEGSGMGLVICRELVLRMGGEMGVESPPGEGTSFWVDLPVQKPKL